MSVPVPETDRAHSERVIASLLLMFLVLAGVALMREGAHFDNTVDGDRLFTISLFTGAIVGFLGWTRATGTVPTFSLSGPMRQLWLTVLVAGLWSVTAASY